VHQNNINAIVDFVDNGSISQLSLATFNIDRLPRAKLIANSTHAIESSTLGGGIRFRTVPLADGDYLLIAVSSADVRNSTHSLILRLLLFIALADLVLGVAVRVVIRRDTKKIEELIGLANDIADKQENVELPESSGRSDVDQLSSALGRMVGTLNDAVVLERNISQRMQQFLGDASHELRTPLTVIRGYTELLRNDRVPSIEVQQRAMSRMSEEVHRMERLISDLLLLTELGEQQVTHDERIDVSSILGTHLDDFRALEPDRVILAEIDPGVTIVAARSRVDRLVQNLFSNIRRHTPATAPVKVVLHELGDVDRTLDRRRRVRGSPSRPTSATRRASRGSTVPFARVGRLGAGHEHHRGGGEGSQRFDRLPAQQPGGPRGVGPASRHQRRGAGLERPTRRRHASRSAPTTDASAAGWTSRPSD
jgi:signal transduction histidine kinase